MYFEIYAGSFFGKAVLMDNEHIVTQINIRANNSKELIDNLASYISRYSVDYVQTNNPAYAAQEIE